MSFLSRWRARTRTWLRRDVVERDLSRELADWVDELAARYEADGCAPDEARRRALVETGGVEQVKDQVRDARERWMLDRAIERLRFDALTACRSLAATPALTAAVVMTIASAAAINLAMVSLIDRALLSPPPHVVDADRVFTVAMHAPGDTGGLRTTMSYPSFAIVRDQVPAVSAAAYLRDTMSLVIDGDQRRVNAMAVSATYFSLLGARPAIGPGLIAKNDDAAEPAVVLSHALWQSAFGGDPKVVGRRVSIRGVDCEVAGVMPDGFSGHSAVGVDLWLPFAVAFHGNPGWDRDPYRNLLSTVVRLAPGQTLEAAETQATRALGSPTTFDSIVGANVGATERQVAWWLGAVALLIFAIGLANAATLLVVRAARRQEDIVIRTALGASRGRLLAQAIVEAMLVAAAATALALAFAIWLDEPIRRVLFPDVVGRSDLARTTLEAAGISGALAFAICALTAVWQIRGSLPATALSGAARRSGRTRALTALLLLQTALSTVLLSGAGMFGQSLRKLAAQDLGMRMDGVFIVSFEQGPGDVPGRNEILAAALEKVRALPGVELASPIDSLPFTGFNVPPISVPGRAEPPRIGEQLPYLIASTPESLKILGIEIAEGRTFTAADDRGAPVVIVNDTMARVVWPGESAIGKCIRIGFDDDFDPALSVGPPMPSDKVPCRQIVGVAHDVRQRSIVPVDNEAHLMQYFVPFSQVPPPPFPVASWPEIRGLLLRTSTGIETLAPQIRRIVVGRRADLPFVRVAAYTASLDRQLRPWRLGTTLLGLFSALALAVAAMGLYAAFAHVVAERRREMAIRIAIGARPGGVLRLILRESLSTAAAGVVAGNLAAIMCGRWVQSLLFETAPSDPMVLGFAAAVMLTVALAATLVPARSASHADPNILLRV